ncbi:MAG: hypothetical protein FJ015_03295 [Chloroflexi bacterium]|nr:hypothetical protein [Chloroflexota bacterium]
MYSNHHHRQKITVTDEIKLRQLTVDEALFRLDQYLHDAFMAGLIQVRVVHGKGTGTLRQAVQKVLAEHPLVKSYRIGGYGEGGTGVTVVQLADK